MERDIYNYWLSNVHGIGAVRIDYLLKMFESAEGVFRATRSELDSIRKNSMPYHVRFSDGDLDALFQDRDEDRIQKTYEKLLLKGIQFITKESKLYPDKLKNIYGAPFALYVRGRLPEKEKKTLAVVGARDCSLYGREMAAYLAGAAAKEGVVIISGLARGIDSYAHKGALSAGGLTYGISGCGIDLCYPKENINLYMEVMKSGGVISEYSPGVQPYAGNFPMRNRIISGLSDAILVVEARKKSGSLITVDMGLEQGKDIYALPGKATDSLSEGCNNLIKMGAKLVTSPADLLEDFYPGYAKPETILIQSDLKLDAVCQKVYEGLSLEPRHIEEISRITQLPIDLLMEQLLFLELNGLARQTMKNYYITGN